MTYRVSKYILVLLTLLLLGSCRKHFTHQRFVANATADSILVLNPDFSDTVFIVPPFKETMIYSYRVLDTKQESEPCFWMGDTLYIEKTNGQVAKKSRSFEYNWTSTVTGNKKNRTQKCVFTLTDLDF